MINALFARRWLLIFGAMVVPASLLASMDAVRADTADADLEAATQILSLIHI